MAPAVTGRTRPTKPKKQARVQKRKRDDVDVEKLEHAVADLDPTAEYKNFTDLPLSEPTKAGLKASHFTTLTDIQAKAIALALKGKNILGAAKTGSGKTLAFLIPVLENLYRAQCIGADAGLGALIISPTRELAIQIFEVLRKIGRKGHLFSAGLMIGGTNLQEQRDALSRMNILVCTPGRILDHLSKTAAFNVGNLRMLVLDEADRILDMGFQRDVDAIVEYLPKDRQTLLFSATQTKKVSDLARLSLSNPEYVSVHESASHATPKTLQQNYIVTPLSDKLDTLWSFIQSSKKSKILVFLSSGKQVRFVYEAFRHLQPGIPLLHLHGRQKQTARLDITSRFSAAKTSCLFATDVVARGLDFPAVDWVVQVDCPEDADTYIHRVGRTARYEREGRAVLFLDPSEEEGMLKRLEHKKVPIERINVKQKKQMSIKNQLQNMCFKDPQLKYLGQKAFISYVKSIHVQKDKEIFKMSELPLEEFAASLGLPGAPRIKFMKGDDAKALKNAPRHGLSSSEDESEAEDTVDGLKGASVLQTKEKSKQDSVRTKYDRMFERRNQDVLADHYAKMIRNDDTQPDETDRLDGEQAEDDDLFTVKRRIEADQVLSDDSDVDSDHQRSENGKHIKKILIPGAKEPLVLDSKRREKLLKSKKKLLKLKDKGTKLVFDDEGNAHPIYEFEGEDQFVAKGAPEEQRRKFLEEETKRVETADLADKEAAREKKRTKREKRKERERLEAEENDDDDGGVTGTEGAEDGFANFLADARPLSDEDEREEPKPKRPKKWFENDKHKEQAKTDRQEPETLEDLEALASGLLG
ncbi:P-loop containing nucleoside triphosphate hydrolase protein [Cryomyces antarcticus]|uniref:ATP-dependent RNA helicase n=1 Tax=Cryomyces antarcticus TaxID=329879 RepID=A0ABR0LQU7_9PEZI|nr:ATP-dependent RNA helicase dbp4 [Cryomyces antarcticus]KAK5018963.1 ATP-dependent RNA helicase dbp4 [Cryomyces antarcticus]KAK5163675.1 ATP-dependent RNA helicase dbp4 [Oleoguttula sp. CCFEE 6159]KAK5201481.1 ATP-dependent RNA helicase dbp4 [Cryomyces antarcticus]